MVNSQATRRLILTSSIVSVIVLVLGVVTLLVMWQNANAVDTLRQQSKRTECRAKASSDWNSEQWIDLWEAFDGLNTDDRAKIEENIDSGLERDTIQEIVDAVCPDPVAGDDQQSLEPAPLPTVRCDTGDGIARTDSASAAQVGC